jgi:hypothetical protein
MLVERVAFLRRRILEFESAVLEGKEPPFDAGTHSNYCNVLMGCLRTLGLSRRSKPVKTPQELLRGE